MQQFVLTPRTEEKYNKINDEFDQMMKKNLLQPVSVLMTNEIAASAFMFFLQCRPVNSMLIIRSTCMYKKFILS